MKYRNLLFICLFVSFLASMKIWFSWNMNYKYISVILGVLVLFIIFKGRIKLEHNKRNFTAFLLLSIAYIFYGFAFEKIAGLISGLALLPIYYVVIHLTQKDKVECLEKITTWFTILLIPSIILYWITLFVSLPSFGTVQVESNILGYLPYDNYIILVNSPFYMYRFTGPFLEPGHLGMMITFLIFANQCNLHKWQVKVLIFIGLFTLSLAAYVLLILAYAFTRLAQNNFPLKPFLGTLLFISLFYVIAINYNNGHNYVNEMIVERLQYDDERGFTGNNRVSLNINYYYERMFADTQYLWNGYDRKFIAELAEEGSRGTGYFMYVVMYGLLGLTVTSLFYVYYTLTSKNRKFAIYFFLFVCCVFWQRCYPFWTSWIMCFVWGISAFQNKERIALSCKLKNKFSPNIEWY